jgi:hypothetical protein
MKARLFSAASSAFRVRRLAPSARWRLIYSTLSTFFPSSLLLQIGESQIPAFPRVPKIHRLSMLRFGPVFNFSNLTPF